MYIIRGNIIDCGVSPFKGGVQMNAHIIDIYYLSKYIHTYLPGVRSNGVSDLAHRSSWFSSPIHRFR